MDLPRRRSASSSSISKRGPAAVVEDGAGAALHHRPGPAVHLGLDRVDAAREQRKAAVHLLRAEPGRLDEAPRLLARGPLRAGEQDAAHHQRAQYLVQVITAFPAALDRGADLRQAQTAVQPRHQHVAAHSQRRLAALGPAIRLILHHHRLAEVLLRRRHLGHFRPAPRQSVGAPLATRYLFQRAQSHHRLGRHSRPLAHRLLDIGRGRDLRVYQLQFHS